MWSNTFVQGNNNNSSVLGVGAQSRAEHPAITLRKVSVLIGVHCWNASSNTSPTLTRFALLFAKSDIHLVRLRHHHHLNLNPDIYLAHIWPLGKIF